MSIKTNLPAFAVNCENLPAPRRAPRLWIVVMIFLQINRDSSPTRNLNFIEGGMTTMVNTWTAGNPVAGELVGMIGA